VQEFGRHVGHFANTARVLSMTPTHSAAAGRVGRHINAAFVPSP